MAAFNGKWQLSTSEGLDKYMQTIGVTDENRAKGKEVLEKVGIEGFAEEYAIVPGKTIKRCIYVGGKLVKEGQPFPFNSEVTGPSLDGRNCKITITENGPNKVTRVEKFDNGVEATTVTELKGDELVTTLTSGSVVSKRTFKKI
jgi:hypothetical protein